MRSSKSRSRSKSNRNRPAGNIVNRVFDSSGPEGKVRGTPQQIIEKYNQLARDAQLSNDRVAFENFQQHAEHYTRMLAEATREQDARREQEQQQRERQRQDDDQGQDSDRNRDGERGRDERPQMNGHDRAEFGGGHGEARQAQSDERRDRAPDREPERVAEPASERRPPDDVIETTDPGDSTLVETPESRPRPRRRRRTAQAETPGEGEGEGEGQRPQNGEAEAAE